MSNHGSAPKHAVHAPGNHGFRFAQADDGPNDTPSIPVPPLAAHKHWATRAMNTLSLGTCRPVSDNMRRWLGSIAIALGVALIVVDTTIVNVIIPSVVRDLDINSVETQWIQESYAIVFAALLLVVGRLADISGSRRVFLGGVILFGLSSLAAGVAPTGVLLIAARFAQGGGAALILPTSLSLLNVMFTGPQRGKAFAVWGSTIGAASALGPLVGGWLAENASWRWAFGVNIPLAVLIFIGSLVFIDRSERRGGRIDVTGALLSVIGLGLLAFGLIEGRTYGWVLSTAPLRLFGLAWASGPSPALVALAVSLLALAGFAVRQTLVSRRRPGEALMNVQLFSIASFRGGNLATLIIGIGEFGIIAVLPLWLQFALGYSPVQAGLALVPVAVGSFVASGVTFGLSAASPLTLVRIGLAAEAAGMALLAAAATAHTPWWHIASVLSVYGLGVGLATAQVTNLTLEDVPETLSGQGSGLQSTFRQLGSALGIAILTTVFFTTMGAALSERLTSSGNPAAEAARMSRVITDSAGAAIPTLAASPETQNIARSADDALAQGVSSAGYVAAGVLVVGLGATLLIPGRARSRRHGQAN